MRVSKRLISSLFFISFLFSCTKSYNTYSYSGYALGTQFSIKYNSTKPKKNKGSAIFLHLTNNYKKTQGCIAIAKKDMLILLKLINKKTKIKIF
jgi:L,D-peptidoglycan transpeptidase YkuD (ErfK/YbiS/YcfS/YnhG family)